MIVTQQRKIGCFFFFLFACFGTTHTWTSQSFVLRHLRKFVTSVSVFFLIRCSQAYWMNIFGWDHWGISAGEGWSCGGTARLFPRIGIWWERAKRNDVQVDNCSNCLSLCTLSLAQFLGPGPTVVASGWMYRTEQNLFLFVGVGQRECKVFHHTSCSYSYSWGHIEKTCVNMKNVPIITGLYWIIIFSHKYVRETSEWIVMTIWFLGVRRHNLSCSSYSVQDILFSWTGMIQPVFFRFGSTMRFSTTLADQDL